MVALRRSRIDIAMHIRRIAVFMTPMNVAFPVALVNCRASFGARSS
jgi:hypothetical protein